MANEYRVVFKGEILEGFDPELVRSKAEKKLKTNPEQITRLFSGRQAVLKKGISAELGERYVQELRRIGMLVTIEAMPAPAPQPTPLPVSSDLEKTQLADPQALSRYLEEQADPANAPTLIVPASRQASLMQAVLPATGAAPASQTMPRSAADMPTMIVTPPGQMPTLVVQQAAPKHDPERTLIANPEALDAYFKSNTGAQPAALATGGINLPNSISDDPHTTQLNPAALDIYLSAAPLQPVVKETLRSVPISITEPEEEAVAVFAPVEAPRPFSAQAAPAAEWQPLENELVPTPRPAGMDKRRKQQLAGAFVALLLLMWWLL